MFGLFSYVTTSIWFRSEVDENNKPASKPKKPCIDNVVFQLHYKATFLMLLAFSLVLTATEYIGDPINCIVDEIPQKIMNVYCWVYSSFTIPNKFMGKIGKDLAHPGVLGHIGEPEEVRYHMYYQWVAFVLMFQAGLFYIPHLVWKYMEDGRVEALSGNLIEPVVDEEVVDKKKTEFVNYFRTRQEYPNSYFFMYFMCELMNFVNVVSQIFFLNTFIGGGFLTYGHDVLQYLKSSPENKLADPMDSMFPKVTKCSFHKYGPSGGIQRFDGLCILSLNILNEKIFFVVWFWFIILAALSGLLIIYRLFMILCPRVRSVYSPYGFPKTYKKELDDVMIRSKLGDWFLLLQLRKNIDDLIFKKFIVSLAAEMKDPGHVKKLL